MTNRFVLLFTTIASLGGVGCSSVFYYPSSFEYVDPSKLEPAPERVEFAAADGVALTGWYFHATGPKRGRILHFHGNAQNMTAHFRFLRHATREGFDHFIFDYRGYGGSKGRPDPRGVVADGQAALRYMASRHDPTPLHVLGQSLGGAIALRSLADLHGEVPVRTLVLDSTFLSYRSAARRVLAGTWLTWPFQGLGWLIVDNSGAPPGDLSHLGVERFIVVHGREDRTVPYVLGERVFEALPEPKEMWSIPNGHHTDFLWRLDEEKRFFAALSLAQVGGRR